MRLHKLPSLSRPFSGANANRLSQQSAKTEAGRVFLSREATWLAKFEREILAFPHRKHDNQIDILTAGDFAATARRLQGAARDIAALAEAAKVIADPAQDGARAGPESLL